MKKMPLLFPLKDLEWVIISRGTLPPLIIYHRRKNVVGNQSILGPLGEYAVCGLGMTSDPEIWNGDRFRYGFFQFKEDAQRIGDEGDIDPKDERLIRFIMAGVVLGERRARINVKKSTSGLNLVNFSDGRLGDLEIAGIVWKRWPVWSSPEFKSKSAALPLHQAHSELDAHLRSMGRGTITPEALGKVLQRLKLPL